MSCIELRKSTMTATTTTTEETIEIHQHFDSLFCLLFSSVQYIMARSNNVREWAGKKLLTLKFIVSQKRQSFRVRDADEKSVALSIFINPVHVVLMFDSLFFFSVVAALVRQYELNASNEYRIPPIARLAVHQISLTAHSYALWVWECVCVLVWVFKAANVRISKFILNSDVFIPPFFSYFESHSFFSLDVILFCICRTLFPLYSRHAEFNWIEKINLFFLSIHLGAFSTQLH